MGKRKKNLEKTENKEEENIVDKKKKNILKKSIIDDKHASQEKHVDTKQSRITDNIETVSNTDDKSVSKKRSRKKADKVTTNNVTPNKKIIFDDNSEAHEVPANVVAKKQKTKPKEPKEEEPTEEEIDQFCAEIEEEDNVEYENWVKLIEAKLSSNKKKT